MSDVKWKAAAQATLIASGGALTAGSREISAAYDNATNLHRFGQFEIACTFGTAPTAGRLVSLYLIPSNDGTNYTDGDGSIAPASNLLVGWGVVRNVNTAQRMTFTRPMGDVAIPLPFTKFKALVQNDADQTISAAWVLKFVPGGEQVG